MYLYLCHPIGRFAQACKPICVLLLGFPHSFTHSCLALHATPLSFPPLLHPFLSRPATSSHTLRTPTGALMATFTWSTVTMSVVLPRRQPLSSLISRQPSRRCYHLMPTIFAVRVLASYKGYSMFLAWCLRLAQRLLIVASLLDHKLC